MPIITTAAILALVSTLANKGLEKAFENVGEEVSDGALDWLKGLFTKKGKQKNILSELKENPDSKAHQNAAKSMIEISLEDNLKAKKFLEEIISKINNNSKINISNSKNINTGDVNSKGGNIQIGDKYGD
jgi:predicted RNA-binding protein Jag